MYYFKNQLSKKKRKKTEEETVVRFSALLLKDETLWSSTIQLVIMQTASKSLWLHFKHTKSLITGNWIKPQISANAEKKSLNQSQTHKASKTKPCLIEIRGIRPQLLSNQFREADQRVSRCGCSESRSFVVVHKLLNKKKQELIISQNLMANRSETSLTYLKFPERNPFLKLIAFRRGKW